MKECAFVITVPVGTSNHNCEDKKQMGKPSEYINNGYNVTHITSSVIQDNMYVYHWLEKETE